MKRLLVNLTEEEHEKLREDAFNNRVSMSELLRTKYFEYQALNEWMGKVGATATPETNPSLSEVEMPPIKKVQQNKNIKTCKHGSMLGLCKYGCKK